MMDILFIAPIDMRQNASAGEETINFYAGYMAEHGCRVRMIAETEPSISASLESFYLLEADNKWQRWYANLQKVVGWVLKPRSRYLFKTSVFIRNQVFSRLQQLSTAGYNPQIIVLETCTAYLWYDFIRKLFPRAKLVADVHDVAYQGTYNRMQIEHSPWRYRLRNRFYCAAKKVEVKALKQMDLILVQNVDNEAILRQNNELSKAPIKFIPPYYTSVGHHTCTSNHDILFYGLMNRPENYMSALWFIDKVMPLLPVGFKFIVMGGKPIVDLKCRADDRIVITGFVSDTEVKEYFEQSFCFVCPLLFGSGIKTKLLTAFSLGIPVLTNDIGIEGIMAEPGRDYCHCQTPEEYAEAIQKLATDTTYYHDIEKNELQVVGRRYDLMAARQTYRSFLEGLFWGEGNK